MALKSQWIQSSATTHSVILEHFHHPIEQYLKVSVHSALPRMYRDLQVLLNRVMKMFQNDTVGDLGSIPGSGRAPGEGNGNLLQYLAWKIPWTEEPGRLQSMG